jgi:YhgE/Pip-like protein
MEGTERVPASAVLHTRAVWMAPVVLASVVVFLMTLFYFGSVVTPASHLRGLPVLLVDKDRGATSAGKVVNLGQQVVHGLTDNPAVTNRLQLTSVSWGQAQEQMNKGDAYAALVIPPTFTSSLLSLAGLRPPEDSASQGPAMVLWTNERLGSIGTELAAGVIQPAAHAASLEIGKALLPLSAPSHPSAAVTSRITDPVTLSVVVYRPLPSHSALGLSAFYISLLALMCGFLGTLIVNSWLDGTLGYAATEIGPKWSQRRPLAISRWQTLLAKGAVVAAIMPVLTGVVVLGAVGVLGMNAPSPISLWLFCTLSALSVAAATLVLLAALGTVGQLIAMLLFVYLALASSGGTVPIQALSGFFRFTSQVEPLRQMVLGNRSLLYFDGQLDAGLGRSLIVIGSELAFWILVGVVITRWYDRKRFDRLSPEIIEYVHRSIDQYQAQEHA